MRTLAPRLALALLAASCAPAPSPAPPPLPAPGVGLRPLACSSARPEQPATATADASGAARLRMAGPRGQHLLLVPRGAAPPGTSFVMRPLPSPGVGVDIRANGQDTFTFRGGRRATLMLSGEHCSDAEWNGVKNHVIVRLGDPPRPVSAPGQGEGRRMRAELGTLSGYAVSGN